MLLDNRKLIERILEQQEMLADLQRNMLIMEPFYKDFAYRFCWNSNSIEGNTLSLDETVAVIDYDEVRSGHTYAEYFEAKCLYGAIQTMLNRNGQEITEKWIREVNARILSGSEGYRKKNLYVGTLIEATYFPPEYDRVPELMEQFVKRQEWKDLSLPEVIERAAREHILFERIHPFIDGNGRTGRMIMNQQLINHGLLPVLIGDQSKYRQAFRRYESGEDISLMVHLIGKGELTAIHMLNNLNIKLERERKDAKNINEEKSKKGRGEAVAKNRRIR